MALLFSKTKHVAKKDAASAQSSQHLDLQYHPIDVVIGMSHQRSNSGSSTSDGTATERRMSIAVGCTNSLAPSIDGTQPPRQMQQILSAGKPETGETTMHASSMWLGRIERTPKPDAVADETLDGDESGNGLTDTSIQSGSATSNGHQAVHISRLELIDGIVDLSQRSLSSLLPRIATYSLSITVLDLSGNLLTALPEEIGHLRHLRVMDVSNNKLRSVPATIAYCQELHTFDVSNNVLNTLPTAMRHIHTLRTVNVSRNALATVPMCLWQLPNADNINLSGNPITALPSRMFSAGGTMAPNTGKQPELNLDGCPLGRGLLDHIKKPSQVLSSRYKYGVIADDGNTEAEQCSRCDKTGTCPMQTHRHAAAQAASKLPSLVDTIICRLANSNGGYIGDLPEHLQHRLDSLMECGFCHRLYPEGTGVRRWRLLYRNKTVWPVEYNFCQPHWSTEKQRIATLFGPRNFSCNQPYHQAKAAATAHTVAKLEAARPLASHNSSTASLLLYKSSIFAASSASQAQLTSSYGSMATAVEERKRPSLRKGIRKLIGSLKGKSQASAGQFEPVQQIGAPKAALAERRGLVPGGGHLRSGSTADTIAESSTSDAPESVWMHFEDDIPVLPALAAQ